MPKTLLAVGAVTLSLAVSPAIAKETDDDAQLREALHQKMSELSGAPAEKPAQSAPPVAPAKAAPAKPAAPAAPAKPAPAPKAAATPVAKPVPAQEPSFAPVMADDPEAAKMREALRQRLEQEAASPAPYVEVAPAPEIKETKPSKTTESKPPVVKETTTAGYAPLEAPPLPISGSKEQRLQQLLEQYKADQITPQEYHTQRAKIIAE